MANTQFAKLPALSSKIYKEWYPRTVLVQSCDDAYEGEFNLETREIDIPVYHDISIHQTSLKEKDVKPADIEFIKASTKRVGIDKGRYNHWGETNLGKLIDRLSAEDSEVRKKIIKSWAIAAEKELAVWCAKLKSKQEIDLITLLGGDGILDSENIVQAFDILKAIVEDNDMEPEDFKLFTSSKMETVLRDAKLTGEGNNLDANEAFRAGFVSYANGVDVRKIQVAALTNRNSTSKVVEAEWGIWKTRDGIQYVVPYKNTVNYTIDPDKVIMGGKGYQSVEYYDFFNLYPNRLYKVKIRYAGSVNPPTSFS